MRRLFVDSFFQLRLEVGVRLKGILYRGFLEGLKVAWSLSKVIFPVTLMITILQHTPILPWFMDLIRPFMSLIGLSGEAAVPLVIGNALNLYASIGAIVSFDFTIKEVFIIAMMLSFSHNLFVENTLAAKVGVNWWIITIVRVGLAIISAVVINLVWDGGTELAQYGLISSEPNIGTGWGALILHGLEKAFLAIVQITVIVTALMIVMQFLREKGYLEKFAAMSSPFTRLLGMESNASTTLVSGLVIGLAFGAGLMMKTVKEDNVSRKDTYLVLIFLVACHAVVEDTLIFVPLGIPVWPLLVIRLTTAMVLTMIVSRIWNYRDHKKRKEEQDEHSYSSL